MGPWPSLHRHPDALAHGGEHTDGQAGLVARLVLGPLSAQSVCMCLCPPGEWGGGVERLLSGS